MIAAKAEVAKKIREACVVVHSGPAAAPVTASPKTPAVVTGDVKGTVNTLPWDSGNELVPWSWTYPNR